MRKLILIGFFLSMLVSHAQGEANIWYFGQNAGLDFNSGSPVALTNGQLVTDEGCATISNSSGQLLFYTDGITVYNKNHVVMINGNGLMGHPSSTQSATIIPKPGSNNLYYVFTLDAEARPNGFRYSIIDMTLDGGNGAVTADKNILIYTPSCEKIAINKHSNNIDYWIVTHGFDNNNFYAHLLTNTGLSSNPVISSVGFTPSIPSQSPFNRDSTKGCMKIAPDGSKLAIAHSDDSWNSNGVLQLLDFNNSTGSITNPVTLIQGSNNFSYGVEFSPNSQVLYWTDSNKLTQFDLTVPNIVNSAVHFIFPNYSMGALQLGPDNKIYFAQFLKNYIGVINNPNIIGNGCDPLFTTVSLGSKNCKLGLPSFNQSFFFTPSITVNSNCVGEPSVFNFSTSQTVLSATWDFGDGATSTSINPTHTYANAGTYNVSITVVTPFGTGTNTTPITIFPKPIVANTIISLKQCDDNNDGFSAFNLTEANELVVASTSDLSFSYFETVVEAQSNSNPILNFTAYTNQTVSTDQIFVRIQNANGCYRVATLNLIVSTTLIPATFQRTFTVCDDALSGSNADGIATFNFSSVTVAIQALYPVGQVLDITYYQNITDALSEQNPITNTSNFTNTSSPATQNIFVRVDSQLDNECLGLGHHITLNVEPLPIISPLSFTHCDDDQDGSFGFDTSNIATTLLNGLTNVALTYWDENNNPLPSPLPNPFNTTTQIVKVRATNNTVNACFFETNITFTVDDLPEVFAISTHLTSVCDDEGNPINQDGLFAFDTSSFQSTILGGQTGMIVNYYDANNNPLPSPLPNPFITTQQNILVEVINPNNSSCKATMIIPFVINPVPNINLYGNELICSDNSNFTKVINAGLIDTSTINNYTYTWFLNNNLIASENQYTLIVNTEGVYTVEVKNTQGCTRTRTITVTASNQAIIDYVVVNDLVEENSIVVLLSASSLGDYVYSLDNTNYQSSNVFSNVMPGIYTVYVKDLKGCGITPKEVSVLGIPKYFTPNGDGYNDYWNIDGVNQNFYSRSIIQIFDRYGKLIKQISSLSQGWDGTFNGNQMPSSDYWYSIHLEDGRNVKGHFSLKR